jgi:hypothetical protein
MKKLILGLALVTSITTAQAQSLSEATTAVTLSPIAAATVLLEAATVMSLAPFATTIVIAQGRGVAGREQIKDELVALNDDMVSGVVKTIEEVRQPTLKELFLEIQANEAHMNEIDSAIKEGSVLFKVSTAVTVSLLAL